MQHRPVATGLDPRPAPGPGQVADPAHRLEPDANQPRMRLLRSGALLPHVHPQRGHQPLRLALSSHGQTEKQRSAACGVLTAAVTPPVALMLKPEDYARTPRIRRPAHAPGTDSPCP